MKADGTSAGHSSFADLIPSWSQDGPTSVRDLLEIAETEPGSLTPEQRSVVSWLHEAVRVSGQVALSSPQSVRKILTFPDGSAKKRGSIMVPSAKWLCLPLTESRHRVLAPNRHNEGNHYRQYITDGAPTAQELNALPPKWGWLLIYGGSPTVLEEQQTSEALSRISKTHKLLDVLFWDTKQNGSPIMHSLKARKGSKAQLGQWLAVDFPNTEVLDLVSKEVVLV